MAQPTPTSAGAPSPVPPGAGRAARLPRDPGRATEQLYKRHGRTVLRYAWHLLGRREDAEDATQATFLAVHSALGGGTAVLEPRAWVLRIARNECMGRLRQTERMPPAGPLHGEIDPPASIGVERAAEVRDELRTARRTLRKLPVPEREAFVLREWLGLDTGEVALALGLTAGDVDGLAGRARRSLVLAVGGLEPAVGCTGTRAALGGGTLDRAARVHLLRCPMCRGVRRALRAPEETAGSRVPIAVVSERLADALPGFASGGGGIVAVFTAKAAAAPLLAKTAALVTAALVTAGVAGQAIRTTHLQHHRVATVATSRGGQAHELVVSQTTTPPRKHTVVLPAVAPRRTAIVFKPQASSRPKARGGVATASHRHGSKARHRSGGGHRDASSGPHAGGGGRHGSGRDHHGHGHAAAAASSQSGDHGDDHGSSDQGHEPSSAPTDGSGTSDTRGEHHGSRHHRHGSHSHDGELASGTAPTTTEGGDKGDGGSDGTNTDGKGGSPPMTTTAPTATAPATTEPTTTAPAATEPTATEPTTTEPTTTEPATTEPTSSTSS